jgi:hypothetical protein
MRLPVLALALALALALFAPMAHGDANWAVCHAGYAAMLERTPQTILLAPEEKSTACTDCHPVHSESASPTLPAVFEGLEPGTAIFGGCHEDVLVQ